MDNTNNTIDSDAAISTNESTVFAHLYKTTGEISQNKRRQDLLDEQKRRREALLDTARGIQDRKGDNSKKRKKFFKNYWNITMLSEWFIQVPADFDVSWLMKICPEGRRNIVVAQKNQTKAYSRRGYEERVFQSFLPGGSKNDNYFKYKTTILDCIWSPKTKTYYVLDVLVWANYDVMNSDAEFRFFWIDSRMAEIPEIENISTFNEFKFHVAPHTTCDYINIKEKLDTYPWYENNKPAVDGLLFYHKEASYSSGYTPLVGWLKPYMVPEILNVPVNPNYLEMRPENYVSLVQYLENIDRLKKQKMEASAEMEF